MLLQIVRPFFGMGQEPEEKEAKPREEKPTVSERVMAAAAHVGDQVQDTLASAMDSGINWKKVGLADSTASFWCLLQSRSCLKAPICIIACRAPLAGSAHLLVDIAHRPA
jgi:hypothetical protein